MKRYLLQLILSTTYFCFIIVLWGCDKDADETLPKESQNTFSENATVWRGKTLIFTKKDGANPSQISQQDRISGEVWLTRGNDGKQIFNIKKNSSANKNTSPEGTMWALGTIDDVADLQFFNFRALDEGKPKNLLGKNLVLHLVEEDIYLSVKFTSWSQDKKGGFAYERSTP